MVSAVQLTQNAGGHVEQLYAIAGPAIDVDGHGEQRAVVAPGKIGDTTEGDVGALLQVANYEIHSVALGVGWRVTTQRDVRSILAQCERCYVWQNRCRSGLQIDDADFVSRQLGGIARAATWRRSSSATVAAAPSSRIRSDREQQPAAIRAEDGHIA